MQKFKDTKVVVMGLGLHGGGVAAAAWFFRHGARVLVTDQKDAYALACSLSALQALCDEFQSQHPDAKLYPIAFRLGGHREEDFSQCDLVLQNPAVPRESPYLSVARSRGIPIENEATIFFLLTRGCPWIGVTGTRGKSTTTALIHTIIKHTYPHAQRAGIATDQGAESFFSILDSVLSLMQNAHFPPIVAELSSWQLELFPAHALAPTVAVVTNVLPDHLNRYRSFAEYARAKKNIFMFQTGSDTVVLNYDNEVTREWAAHHTPGKKLIFSKNDIPIDWGLVTEGSFSPGQITFFERKGEQRIFVCAPSSVPLPGMHNIENMLAAVAAARALGITPVDVCRAFGEFRGLPGRLEKIASFNGRDIYNDTTSTTPDAACAALQTLGGELGRPIILIAGGEDKGLSYDALARALCQYCKAVVFLPGHASELSMQALGKANYHGKSIHVDTMERAVEAAWHMSVADDILLLSPAASSFASFANEFDRGKQFRDACAKLFNSQPRI